MKKKLLILLALCAPSAFIAQAQQTAPTLRWGTYYGGPSALSTTNTDYGAAVACDALGNIYMTGNTTTPQNMATPGAFKETFSGYIDGFLVKFNCAGERIWATYIGGDTLDKTYGRGLVTDPEGNIYVTGYSDSKQYIATQGAHKTAPEGTDAFLIKLDSSGKILWGTYFGGSKDETSTGIALDAEGNVYIGGSTQSSDGIATANAQQAALDGAQDGFLAKFSRDGKLLWGTYYGGTGGLDEVMSVACNSDGDVYIGGVTDSKGDSTHIATSGAFKTGLTGSPGKGGVYPSDGFLAKFSGEGIRLWGTYFGADVSDAINSIAVNRFDQLYVTGYSSGTTGIATAGSYQPANAGSIDAFLGRFDDQGKLLWCTYYGDATGDQGTSVACDMAGNVFMTGFVSELSQTVGGSALATTGSYQTENAGWIDVFVARFDSTGARSWGSYYGGTGDEKPGIGDHGIAYDGLGNFYLTGLTGSQTGIATPGSFEEIGGLSGRFTGGDAFLTSFYDSCTVLAPPAVLAATDTICPKGAVTYSLAPVCGITHYAWTFPNGSWKGESNTSTLTATAGITSGENIIRVAAINSCGDTGLVREIKTYVYPYNYPVISVNGFTLSTNNSSRYLSWQWFLNGQIIQGATDSTYQVSTNGDYTVAVEDINGCLDTSDIYRVTNAGIADASGQPTGKIRVFPNPTHSVLYISATQKFDLAVISIDGRMMKQTSNTSSISVKELPDGMYFLYLRDKGKTIQVEKFIKAEK